MNKHVSLQVQLRAGHLIFDSVVTVPMRAWRMCGPAVSMAPNHNHNHNPVCCIIWRTPTLHSGCVVHATQPPAPSSPLDSYPSNAILFSPRAVQNTLSQTLIKNNQKNSDAGTQIICRFPVKTVGGICSGHSEAYAVRIPRLMFIYMP